MFEPPIVVLPPSTERIPISDERRRDLIKKINSCVESQDYKSENPTAIREVGKLLSKLGDYEVACTYFEFADWIETKKRREDYARLLADQSVLKVKSVLEIYNKSSFFLKDDTSVVDALLQELMQRKGIPVSKRGEFLREFHQLADRHSSRKFAEVSAEQSPDRQKKTSTGIVWQDIKLPPGLKWPSRTYSKAAKAGVSIIDHLEAEWKDLIAAGIGTRQVVDAFDRSTTRGIENFIYGSSDKTRRVIPPHLLPLTKSQVIDRAIKEDSSIVHRDHRVLQTMSNRVRRGTEKERIQSLLNASPR